MSLSSIFFSLSVAAVCYSAFPGLLSLRLFREPVDNEVRRDISRLRGPSFLLNLCSKFSFFGDNLIVAFFTSPAMVVPFTVTQTAASLVGRELQGIGGSSWPALAELHGQGQSSIFNERLIDLTRLVAILAFAGLVPIAVYNQFFV